MTRAGDDDKRAVVRHGLVGGKVDGHVPVALARQVARDVAHPECTVRVEKALAVAAGPVYVATRRRRHEAADRGRAGTLAVTLLEGQHRKAAAALEHERSLLHAAAD